MLLILGKTNDDKGCQLEGLTKRLLICQGFKKVTTSKIGPGGHEIDVEAISQITSLTHSETHRLYCECKAYQLPIDINDWLKFLGKMMSFSLQQGEKLTG